MRPLLRVMVASLLLAGCGVTPTGLSAHAPLALGAMDTGLGSSSGLQLFTEPDDGVQPVVDAIASARSSVKMEMYMLTNQDVINALTSAVGRGVAVSVMLEQHPYQGNNPPPTSVNQAAYDALQSAGAKVNWSNPQFTYTHEKAIVIDSQESVITTANMTNGAFSKNREYGLVDTDPTDAQAVEAIFDADWNRQQPSFDDPNLVVSPDNSRSQFEKLFSSARKSIAIEDEEVNDPAIIKLLGQKVRSGVQVTVELAGAGAAADPSLVSSVQSEVRALKQAGVKQVKVLSSLYLHAKMFLVDGQRAYVGSVNLSANSMDNNREVGLLLDDAGLVSQLRQTGAKDWANGKQQ